MKQVELESRIFEDLGNVTCLAGGVGAARFLQGLVRVVPEEDVTVVVNTGDDIELYGLHISPDIDIVTYTLAGLVDEEKGWGISGDTYLCLDMLSRYGYDTWFKLGDKDLATHIDRTHLLEKGMTLSQVTERHTSALRVEARILPMSNDRFETHIETGQAERKREGKGGKKKKREKEREEEGEGGLIHFQEYLVKRGAPDTVTGVHFKGAEEAEPAPGVIDSIMDTDAMIVCPSNPVVSIGTILAVRGVREALRKTDARTAAVTPIVSGAPIKGPADKLMRGLGLEVSVYGVAELYKDFLDTMIIDTMDEAIRTRIEELGIQVVATDTLMRTLEDKVRLAKTVMKTLLR